VSLIDGHCHLANLNDVLSLEPLLAEARAKGIERFLSSALTKSEIQYHLEHEHQGVLFSAGIHPNFDDCDLELCEIKQLCDNRQIWAVGEIGLDRYNPDLDWQKDILIRQLEQAAEHSLPVVLHLIGFQQQAYEILKRFPLKYLVHSYAGSLDGFNLLCRLDSAYTISERILRPDKIGLLKAIVSHGSFLWETDITKYYVHPEESNPLLRLLNTFTLTSGITGVAESELLQMQDDTYNKLTEVTP
jgi:TatD DNase family protein